ncbi:ubiquitin-associated domain-containing protein 1 [Octopus bimaculoides]|uniref:Ubiquitin-associated domain-containing protein 1 n=1 Tax=Octopus bimaculoides TaxID=37653 RepID=A0A0L8I379_OCTBM|nr:ubiquitin-associated domain-containing protein 1 [Octopus bimaculoides]XP_014791186.1 ubiquitin-associated domain-containing protein 1 [Octopus bimaculoides]|eukprot:XP_014791185.1 PREDICTED: ubiquitin-associated domain-containing protein 1-like [Octopus bimaculoides]
MFVSDTLVFSPSTMKVRITNMEGVDIIDEFRPDLTVDMVKIRSLSQLFSPMESMKVSLYHKVLLVRTGKVLNEESTLQQEGLRDNDEIIILKRRLPPFVYDGADKKEESRKGPNSESVNKATAGLTPCNMEPTTDKPPNGGDFQSEFRKILITLIEASQKILCLKPDASKIFRHAEEISNQYLPCASKMDETTVKKLTDMGFPEDRARKALALNKMNFLLAMEWLLTHNSNSDTDTPLSNEEDEENEETEKQQLEGATAATPNQSAKANSLINSLKRFKKREFRPNPRALLTLMEMGFEESEAISALRVAGNNQDTACEWLLGDRKTVPSDVDEGLDVNGPIYKAIMSNPIIQVGLNNPRCLLAFILMLESPLTANQWLSDAETGPVLLQVSRIYHAEKNSNKALASQNSLGLGGSTSR